MSTLLVAFPRAFELWLYGVSHGQLLFRSNKGTKYQTRVDVLFVDVSSIESRSSMPTLSVSIDDRLVDAAPLHAKEVGQHLFVLDCGLFTGKIVAGNAYWHEDSGHYGDPSQLLLDPDIIPGMSLIPRKAPSL